jgi:hypothetical protein
MFRMLSLVLRDAVFLSTTPSFLGVMQQQIQSNDYIILTRSCHFRSLPCFDRHELL